MSDADTLGKNIGDDLAEGKPTLPLIYAIERSTPMQAELLRNAITSQRLAALDVIVAAIRQSGALERTRARAQAHADAAHAALATLPPSEYRDALAGLAAAAGLPPSSDDQHGHGYTALSGRYGQDLAISAISAMVSAGLSALPSRC